MKKAIISILLILPFLLIVVISIAGRIYGDYDYVEVTNVYFTDDEGTALDLNSAFSIDLGLPTQMYYTVLPENASNKNVTFSSSNPSIATIDANGVITGNAIGTADITISTYNMSSTIHVSVVEDMVHEVILNRETITGNVGGTAQLSVTILPSTAVNQNVTWASSNPEICSVNSYGTLTFHSVGTATITATSTDPNRPFDTCIVTVTDDSIIEFTVENLVVHEPTLDLTNYLTGDLTDLTKINFEIISGNCTIADDRHTLTFNTFDSAEIRVYFDGNRDVYDSIRIYYKLGGK